MPLGATGAVTPDARFVLPLALHSVAELRRVTLIGAGTVVNTREFEDAPREGRVAFVRIADGTRSYSLEVEDVAGRKARSNLI